MTRDTRVKFFIYCLLSILNALILVIKFTVLCPAKLRDVAQGKKKSYNFLLLNHVSGWYFKKNQTNQSKHWTIRRRDNRSVNPASHEDCRISYKCWQKVHTLGSRIEVPVRLFFFGFFSQPVCLIWVYAFNRFLEKWISCLLIWDMYAY